MAACKRLPSIRRIASSATTGAMVELSAYTMAFLIRVVDAAGAGIAWELGLDGASDQARFHFSAGETLSEEDLALGDQGLRLRVFSGAGFVEVLSWER